jgi:glycosyltransferase involved in cell wall biosynthesis
MEMNVSVIICTRDRAARLDQTLSSLEALTIPAGLSCEVVVVDNGSTDQTPQVVRKHSAARIPPRYLLESEPGQSRARNTGVAASEGEIILFTDDDVVPAKDWLERMCRPLLERECDGAVGHIELAKEVCRPWMTEGQKAGLAFYDGPGDGPLELIGANMGFHRSVIERVPAFDPEIGPGALGLFDDTLFSWQLAEAGFRLRYIPEASVIHYPDPTRLLRRHCLSAGRTFGISKAYVLHHWQHEKVPFPRLRYCYVGLKLRLRRLLEPPPALDVEGIAPWEMSYVAEMEKNRQFLIERQRPRNYSKRGLRKIGGYHSMKQACKS